MARVSLEPGWVIVAKGPRTGSPQTYDNHAMNHRRPMAVNHNRRAFPSPARASPAGISPTIVSVTGNQISFSIVPAIISATATHSFRDREQCQLKSFYREALHGGAFHSDSKYRLFRAQRLHGFDGSGAAGRDKSCRGGAKPEHQGRDNQRNRIVTAYFIQLVGHQMAC